MALNPDPRLSMHHRVAALASLERTAWDLNQAAAWLSDNGHETEADMIESSARSILAACWLLGRPIRPTLPPERWQQAR